MNLRGKRKRKRKKKVANLGPKEALGKGFSNWGGWKQAEKAQMPQTGDQREGGNGLKN